MTNENLLTELPYNFHDLRVQSVPFPSILETEIEWRHLMSFKTVVKLAVGAAAVCAGALAYRKLKDKKEPVTVWDDEPEKKEPEKNEQGNVVVHVDIPGILTEISVKPGDHVNKGDTLALIGNNLPVEAPAAGTVLEVKAETNRMVSADDDIMTIQAE